MIPTRGAGVTAAAGTSLSRHLFAEIFTLGKSLAKLSTLDSLITLSCIVKVSRLLHPVGLGQYLSALLRATPLRARTDLRIGEPLPHQQPNPPPTHP